MEKIKIYVLTHKKFNLDSDDIYVPLLNGSVNSNEDFGYLRDDTGDNISHLNKYYAELTGEYWAFKNSDADIIGFCHYRRFFVKDLSLEKLNNEDIKEILSKYDMILPTKVHLGMTSLEDCKKSYEYLSVGPKIETYDLIRDIIKKDCPDYLDAYNEVLNAKTAHWYNMFICRKELADDYFKWLFDVLEKVKSRIDFTEYPENNQRLLGYLSERLLNVYVRKHDLKIKELPIVSTEQKFPKLYILAYRTPTIIPLYKFYAKVRKKLKG